MFAKPFKFGFMYLGYSASLLAADMVKPEFFHGHEVNTDRILEAKQLKAWYTCTVLWFRTFR